MTGTVQGRAGDSVSPSGSNGAVQFYPAHFWRKRLKGKVLMRYSLPCLPHKLIAQFNKLTGGSTSEGADVILDEPSPPSPSPRPLSISFLFLPLYLPLSPHPFPFPFFPLIYEQLQYEMFCVGSMNTLIWSDDGVVLI